MSKVTTGSNDSPTTRVGLITGAAQGIGRDIALRLARDGLDVALNDVPGKLVKLEAVRDEILEQARASGTVRRCVVMPGDVSKEAEVAGIVEQVVKELGGLDVVRSKETVSLHVLTCFELDGGQCGHCGCLSLGRKYVFFSLCRTKLK